MKEAAKSAAGVVGVGANQVSWNVAVVLLNRRFHWGLDGLEIAAISATIATCVHAVAKYGRPIAAALYRRLLAAVGATLLLT